MSSKFLLLRSALGSLFLALVTWNAPGAAPRLLDPLVTGGNATIRLQGDSGVTYRIEASTNLSTWVTIGTGAAQNGLFTVQHSGLGNSRWVYYRGVQEGGGGGGGKPFPTVTPAIRTNLVTSAVLMPGQETVLRLRSTNQTDYTLTFPIGSVSEPTTVTMTELGDVTGLPNQKGLLGGVRLEPGGLVLLAPAFLQMDFPDPMDGRQVSSFGFDNDGTRLHLVPDVVVATASIHRAKVLVTQLRSHGSGLFTLAELEALAATVPPARATPSRASLHNDLAGCYPEDEREAVKMQKDLEDLIRPLQQDAAATLGAERQRQLLGVSDDAEGTSALIRVMQAGQNFYETELRSRLPAAREKCALARTLAPWALGFERQQQLLGVIDEGPSISISSELLCSAGRRCQEQAIQCCRSQGGDTRLVQTLLGIERQRALLGAGAECGQISVDEVIRECAPEWFGTLSFRTSGNYLNLETNGNWHIRRTSQSEMVVTATVTTAKVRAHEASLFAPAYTNITLTLSGRTVASDRMEKLEENRESNCNGEPSASRLDTWTSAAAEDRPDLEVEALIMDPGASSVFIKPYLRILDRGAVRDMRWFYEERQTTRSQFSDEDCETKSQTGGSYEPDAGNYGVSVFAGPDEFTWTADTIRYTYQGTEPMRFDFEHLFNGIRDVTLELHRVK